MLHIMFRLNAKPTEQRTVLRDVFVWTLHWRQPKLVDNRNTSVGGLLPLLGTNLHGILTLKRNAPRTPTEAESYFIIRLSL